MTPQTLLAHFDKISDAPDAVSRLRRFILDLAVRGKLVEQDPKDEPAAELLKRIAIVKANFVKGGGSRNSSRIQVMAQEETPFAIAPSWTWVRFGDIVISRDGERIPVSKEERNSLEKKYDYYGASGVIDKIDNFLFDKPLLLIGEDGANLVNRSTPIAFIARGKYWVNNHAHVLDGISEDFLRFLELFINATDLKPFVTGTAQPKMNQAKMNSIPVALPPLAEQKRIVAKVDELMALCDRLEAAKAEKEQTRNRLTSATLARLNAPAADGTEFTDHARFALDNLPAITTRPEQVKQIRQTILNLAVRGKLVKQDPEEGDGKELLEQLRKAKLHWEASGRIRKQKVQDRGAEEEKLLEIPRNWTWGPLFEIGHTQTGTSPSSENRELFGNFIPFVKPADLNGNEIDYTGPGLSAEGVNHSRLAPEQTVLMVCIGATLGKVNKTTRPICFNQQINSLTPYLEGLSDYVACALKSSAFQTIAWSKAGTGTLPIISKGKWEVIAIPLPPLAEQKRIVAKVDELMALCDKLEAALTAKQTESSRLLEAVLHGALLVGH